jgi:hypothetical protein
VYGGFALVAAPHGLGPALLKPSPNALREVQVRSAAAVTPTGRLVAEREATGRRLGWFGPGSRKQRTLAREHAAAQPADKSESAACAK